eukprot:gene27583-33314_t
MTTVVNVGDEGALMRYEEEVIFELQSFFRRHEGMAGVPVLDMCMYIEDHLYQETLKKYGMPATASIVQSLDSIVYFQDRCSQLIEHLALPHHSSRNWKKVLEDTSKLPSQIYKMLMQEESGRAKARPKTDKQEVVAKVAPPKAPPAPRVASSKGDDEFKPTKGKKRNPPAPGKKKGALKSIAAQPADDFAMDIDDQPGMGDVGVGQSDPFMADDGFDDFGFEDIGNDTAIQNIDESAWR